MLTIQRESIDDRIPIGTTHWRGMSFKGDDVHYDALTGSEFSASLARVRAIATPERVPIDVTITDLPDEVLDETNPDGTDRLLALEIDTTGMVPGDYRFELWETDSLGSKQLIADGIWTLTPTTDSIEEEE